jgi:hypothetical protein
VYPGSGSAVPGPADADSAAADELANVDLTGYRVEASDGHLGSIDEASYEAGSACLVVDTGPWIFGRKVLLPVGTVQHVDHAERKVYVDRTGDQIKDSPEYDEHTFDTSNYRQQVGDYLAPCQLSPGASSAPTEIGHPRSPSQARAI